MLQVFRAYFGITEQDDDRDGAREDRRPPAAARRELPRGAAGAVRVLRRARPGAPARRAWIPRRSQRQLFAVLRRLVQRDAAPEPAGHADRGPALDRRRQRGVPRAVGRRHRRQPAACCSSTSAPSTTPRGCRSRTTTSLPLAPLGPEAIRELLADLLGNDPSIAGLADAIHARTGGNPVLHRGGRADADRVGQPRRARAAAIGWSTPVDAARGAGVRAGGARGAHRSAGGAREAGAADGGGDRQGVRRADPAPRVAETAAGARRRISPRRSRRSRTREFVYEQALYPVAEYAFKHPLTQEVALGSQLQERRRQVHAAVARAIEAARRREARRAGRAARASLGGGGRELERGALAPARRRVGGTNDIAAALRHWQRVRELARHGGDGTRSRWRSRSWPVLRRWPTAGDWGRRRRSGRSCLRRAAPRRNAPGIWRRWRSSTPPTAPRAAINQGIATDYVHYAGEAVRIADRTGDAALRCGTRGSLLFAHEWSGQLRERGARKRRSHRAGSRRSTPGRPGGGLQSLAGRTCSVRQRCIGFHPRPRDGPARAPATCARSRWTAATRNRRSGRCLDEAGLQHSALGSSDGMRALAHSRGAARRSPSASAMELHAAHDPGAVHTRLRARVATRAGRGQRRPAPDP